MENLTNLPNIGPNLAAKLNQIGITNFDELAEMGSNQAVLRIRQTEKTACYNLLYALEGAIRGVRWHAIPKVERAALKASFDAEISS